MRKENLPKLNLKMTYNNVAVLLEKPVNKSSGGIVLPEQNSVNKPVWGTVAAQGGGYPPTGGSPARPLITQVGDRVLIRPYVGAEYEVDGVKYQILPEDVILAVEGKND